MMSISLSDIATLNIKGADYQRVISGIGHYYLFSHVKMGREMLKLGDIEI